MIKVALVLAQQHLQFQAHAAPKQAKLCISDKTSLQPSLTPTTIADTHSTTHTHQQRRLPLLRASPSRLPLLPKLPGTEHQGQCLYLPPGKLPEAFS